jgi:hypothetical protein
VECHVNVPTVLYHGITYSPCKMWQECKGDTWDCVHHILLGWYMCCDLSWSLDWQCRLMLTTVHLLLYMPSHHRDVRLTHVCNVLQLWQYMTLRCWFCSAVIIMVDCNSHSTSLTWKAGSVLHQLVDFSKACKTLWYSPDILPINLIDQIICKNYTYWKYFLDYNCL